MKSFVGCSVLVCAIAVFGLSVGEDAGPWRGPLRMRREYTGHPAGYSGIRNGQQSMSDVRVRRQMEHVAMVTGLLSGATGGGAKSLPGVSALGGLVPGMSKADPPVAPPASTDDDAAERRRRQSFFNPSTPHAPRYGSGFRHQRF